MKKAFYLMVAGAVFNVFCVPAHRSLSADRQSFDFQAHRGGRGLMPENTIPAMRTAIDLGVTTLEMDVVISKDNKVVVSHDPLFSDAITTTPAGGQVSKKESEQLLLYNMNYDSIRKYDVGIKPHPGFPRQMKMRAYKPLLAELIDSVERYAATKGKSLFYNIEVKSKEGFDGIRHPEPASFSELLISVLKEKKVLSRTIIQSFDVRPLKYIHASDPAIKLSYLVDKTSAGLDAQLDKLGFIPHTYSPLYTGVTKELVGQCHTKGMKVIPWTANTLKEINDLVDMGVDGIISDYPDLFFKVVFRK